MTSVQEDLLSAPPEIHSFAGILIDMDGTIVDSTEAIIMHWHKIGKELGFDPAVVLATSHGRRSIDTLRLYDASKANWQYVRQVEGNIPKEFGADAQEVPGARAFLAALGEADAPWAIVTSGTRPLMDGWLDRMRLAYPKYHVVAEDVDEGKPHPGCYNLGKARLGLRTDDIALVIEDAPAGVRAGKAAGCQVVGLLTTHSVEQLRAAGADWIIKDMRSIELKGKDKMTGLLNIELKNIVAL